MINKFDGEYRFLSNFYEAPVTYDGITYTNNEAAFQAQKVLSPDERARFIAIGPSQAKSLGRRVALRSDWEQIKYDVMYGIVRAKFEQNADIKEKLLATGNEELIEGNTWNDRIWGVCNGVGENHLGRTLMRVREELRANTEQTDPVVALTDRIVDWIRDYFEKNATPEHKAIVGISGGKDSSVVAALCVKALGKDRVFGVLMPRHKQSDIDYSYKLVEHLGIDYTVINIGKTVDTLKDEIIDNLSCRLHDKQGPRVENPQKYLVNDQMTTNMPARIRMTTLYAVAACVGGRVANTCNLSEDFIGYSTKFGDSAGDFSPLAKLTVTEVRQIGRVLGLPSELVDKVPTDGLCGKTDEENIGFSYDVLDAFIKDRSTLADNHELANKILDMNRRNKHKLELMPCFTP